MKKPLIIVIVVVVLFLLASYSFVKGTYNGMVSREENVKAQWSQVENVYQRRADLIPNLVSTVKGYAKHEQTTLTAVIDARSKATAITVNPEHLDAQSLKKYQQAQGDPVSTSIVKRPRERSLLRYTASAKTPCRRRAAIVASTSRL